MSAPLQPVGLSIPRHAWPKRLGPLFGRDDDLRAVQDALDRAALVTVVGGAGVGETRLAQEVHARRADAPGAAVAWIALEPVESAERVPLLLVLDAMALLACSDGRLEDAARIAACADAAHRARGRPGLAEDAALRLALGFG